MQNFLSSENGLNMKKLGLSQIKGLHGVVLAPSFCENFSITAQFIGSNGQRVKTIQKECQDQVIIRIVKFKDIIQVHVGGLSCIDSFIKAIRLCQARLI